MAGLFDRVGALAGTDLSKAVDLGHATFRSRMGEHKHMGRALVETVAEICREHPNLVGIGAGLLVEQLLVHERRVHGAQAAAESTAHQLAAPLAPPWEEASAGEPLPASSGLRNAHLPPELLRLSRLRPGRVAMEVFGAILMLKLAATGAKMFSHKHQKEVWFAGAAKIRLFSGSIAAYNLASAIRSPKVSAWRNGAIFFFGTDALKPMLKSIAQRRR
jgi:hypothetical protein